MRFNFPLTKSSQQRKTARHCKTSMKCNIVSIGQWRNDGGARGAQFSGRRIIMGRQITAVGAKCLLGASKIPNNFTSTFFRAVNFLPQDLRFEHGDAELASCPGRHLTSLRSWHWILRLVVFARFRAKGDCLLKLCILVKSARTVSCKLYWENVSTLGLLHMIS